MLHACKLQPTNPGVDKADTAVNHSCIRTQHEVRKPARLTVNYCALKPYLDYQHVQWLMQKEQEERLHAQRMPGGLQDDELALEIRASLLDATPWAPQVLLIIPCSIMHTLHQPACCSHFAILPWCHLLGQRAGFQTSARLTSFWPYTYSMPLAACVCC